MAGQTRKEAVVEARKISVRQAVARAMVKMEALIIAMVEATKSGYLPSAEFER